MVSKDTKIDFHQHCYRFFRDNEINREDFCKILAEEFKSWAEEDCSDNKDGSETISKLDERESLPMSDVTDFRSLWEKYMQMFLDYMNEHPIVLEKAKEMKKRNSEVYESKYGSLEIVPDIRVYFSADGLDESIENKKWVPTTDSHFGLYVDTKPVISMM